MGALQNRREDCVDQIGSVGGSKRRSKIADKTGSKLGMERRRFLRSAFGMAAAFVAATNFRLDGSAWLGLTTLAQPCVRAAKCLGLRQRTAGKVC
jgi:hypothetical protein